MVKYINFDTKVYSVEDSDPVLEITAYYDADPGACQVHTQTTYSKEIDYYEIFKYLEAKLEKEYLLRKGFIL